MNKAQKKLAVMLGALCGIAAYVAPLTAADVGVSISIGEPDYYGRIDIGDAPRPRLLYTEPYLVDHDHVIEETLYLRVPPGHAKNWRKHCHVYNACRQRTYFVQDDWYHNVYTPHYRRSHGHGEARDNHGDRDRDNHGRGLDHDKVNRDKDKDKDKDNHGNGNHGR